MKLKSVNGLNLKGKRVLLRVDFNVSLTSDFQISSDARIREVLPTIKFLLKKGATVILCSHLGRPKGKVDKRLSLAKVSRKLESYLKKKVLFLENFWEKEANIIVGKLKPGSLVLLENIRFHEGEERNDPQFAKDLALLADLFVNDAFGTAHRAHASTVGVTQFLPSYAGLLLQKEIETIHKAFHNPKRPFLVIIGGGKTPEKIRVIEKLLDRADTIYLGGAVANTFFATWGISVGVSKVDYEMIEMARQVFWKATQVSCRLILPKDVVVNNGVNNNKPLVLPYNKIPQHLGIYDIGPQSLAELKKHINAAKTIIWNGPMGVYEDPKFKKGTEQTLEFITASRAKTIVGGGDTISNIKGGKLKKKISHISTGGGAMLEFLEKGTLPAIEVLKE